MKVTTPIKVDHQKQNSASFLSASWLAAALRVTDCKAKNMLGIVCFTIFD